MKYIRVRTFAGVIAVLALLNSGVCFAQTPPDQAHVIHISASSARVTKSLPLALNQAVIVELERDVRDVVVANPAIADAVVKTPRRIFVMSLKPGQTNMLFVDAQGTQIANLQVSVDSELSDLNEQMARQMPDAHVKVSAVGDQIVLAGTVKNTQEASLARTLAEGFITRSTGKPPDPKMIINNLSIDARQQVLIQVRVSEMSRAISKQFGINGVAVAKAGGVPIVVQSDNQFSLVGHALTNMFLAAGNTGCGSPPSLGCSPAPNNVSGVMQALERIGLVHTLAEPNLTAVSGEPAKFLAGGEFPVPIGHDRDGNITIEYKPFGVGLAFTPVVLSEGRISLQVSTEVSELTNTGALTLASGVNSSGQVVQGLTLPALSVRRTETMVELPSGGSLSIGGLIQQQTKQNLDSLPGVKDLPVLGALFRSRDFQNNESELVITVTAYLVNPAPPTQLAGPDDGFAPAGDLETILLGRLNAIYGKQGEPPPVADRNSLGYVIQ